MHPPLACAPAHSTNPPPPPPHRHGPTSCSSCWEPCRPPTPVLTCRIPTLLCSHHLIPLHRQPHDSQLGAGKWRQREGWCGHTPGAQRGGWRGAKRGHIYCGLSGKSLGNSTVAGHDSAGKQRGAGPAGVGSARAARQVFCGGQQRPSRRALLVQAAARRAAQLSSCAFLFVSLPAGLAPAPPRNASGADPLLDAHRHHLTGAGSLFKCSSPRSC